ncbi:MAG: DUF3048 domain-containing protein [Clostridiales bacterium]|nr:DUF3048 domain-containing protein [Clostridiales bacterium]
MKKYVRLFLFVLSCTLLLQGCGKKKESEDPSAAEPTIEVITHSPDSAEAPAEEESREGMYRSELTNEWIDETLKNQRPVAVMIDNDSRALDHIGISHADVLYELTNSTKNNGITRLMAVIKDYEDIELIGSMRSARPSFIQLMCEWNAVFCYFGGPFYIDDYIAKDHVNSINGNTTDSAFKRVDNGKATEFTAYAYGEGLASTIEKKWGKDYNQYYEGAHYQFTSESNPVSLASASDAVDATRVDLPFPLNSPYFEYNESDGLYYRWEYNKEHKDGENGEQLAFKNLLLQNTRYVVFDDNGYMMFHSIDYDREGYYITNGKAIPVTWSKADECSPTQYFDADGNEIQLNTGKTYVALIPDDIWSGLKLD